MFEKFGEFDSYEEINRVAVAQKKEGDKEAVYSLAKENGISELSVEDFLHSGEALVYPLTAAIGKLQIEKKALKIKESGVLSDMVEELIDLCTEDLKLCLAIRKRDKHLAEYLALIIEEGYQKREVVDEQIIKHTTVVKKVIGIHKLSIGVPSRRRRQDIAESYYKEKTRS